MSATTDRISRIQLVLVPSTDQDRSLAFYEALGFERRNDIPWGELVGPAPPMFWFRDPDGNELLLVEAG